MTKKGDLSNLRHLVLVDSPSPYHVLKEVIHVGMWVLLLIEFPLRSEHVVHFQPALNLQYPVTSHVL